MMNSNGKIDIMSISLVGALVQDVPQAVWQDGHSLHHYLRDVYTKFASQLKQRSLTSVEFRVSSLEKKKCLVKNQIGFAKVEVFLLDDQNRREELPHDEIYINVLNLGTALKAEILTSAELCGEAEQLTNAFETVMDALRNSGNFDLSTTELI